MIYVLVEMGLEDLVGLTECGRDPGRRFDPIEPRPESENPYRRSLRAVAVELGTVALGTIALLPLTRLRVHMRTSMVLV